MTALARASHPWSPNPRIFAISTAPLCARHRHNDLAEAYSDAQLVSHSRSHVARTTNSIFFLQLMLEGESISRQDGRESHLRAGDFTLCDSTRRYEITFTGPNRMLVLGIPSAKLRRQVGWPECECAIPMPVNRGPAASCLSCCVSTGASITGTG